jgi:hypothetical protein
LSTDKQEIQEVTNNGSCMFIGCEEKASGWVYQIKFSRDTIQMLHACRKHVEIFQCDQDNGIVLGATEN